MNDSNVPFSAVEIISSRVRVGSEIAAGNQNLGVCFGKFVADGYRKNPMFLNFSRRNQAISPI
jgi:hypothetical protein